MYLCHANFLWLFSGKTCSEKYQCSAVNRPEGDVIGEKRGVSTFSPNFEESKGNEEGLSEEHPVRRGVTSEERL